MYVTSGSMNGHQIITMLSLCSKTLKSVRSLDRGFCSVVELPMIPEYAVQNIPLLEYRMCSPERYELIEELKRTSVVTEEVPIVIGDECIREGQPRFQVMPHDHQRQIVKYYHASEKTIQKAIEVGKAAAKCWDRTPLVERICIWERAASLIEGEQRQRLNAATMLGQSKTVIQAEIDGAAELADFFRFNGYFLKENAKYQPISVDPSVTKNSIRFRGIGGFFASISPFNFTAIGGNLAYTPALMGNAVLWKPSDTAILSNWRIFNVMREAGIPPGVVNFLPSDGPTFGKTITASPDLAGINFTGSVPTYNWLWGAVAKNLDKYRNYPRLIGECGGKNFHFIHCSADVEAAVAATIRSAFEYCGQKCSACARLYVPRSLHEPVIQGLLRHRATLKVGDVADFTSFMGAVIDKTAYTRIIGYINAAKKNSKNKILAGGEYDDKTGYFINPTIIETTDPCDKLMTEEIFGPVLTVYTYEDANLMQTLDLVCNSTRFALTGAIFATDPCFQQMALDVLKLACGNFYINDKSTGAVVGQQPFGGGCMSGTNDKAGAPVYLHRFTSPQSIKETFVPQREVLYPYMTD